jgi:hypothetical protein
MNRFAAAPNSTARGLFQFIEGTWLELFARHGAGAGFPNLARRLHRDVNGAVGAADRRVRQRVLMLRYDPVLSVRFAALLAAENRARLMQELRRPVSDDEVYAAHLFGAAGAARLILAARSPRPVSAAAVLPSAAQSNRALFYRDGRPVSASAVLERIRRG